MSRHGRRRVRAWLGRLGDAIFRAFESLLSDGHTLTAPPAPEAEAEAAERAE